MSKTKQEELDKSIEELIEFWDFQPHQDEDARLEANRNKIKKMVNQQVLSALKRVENKIIHSYDTDKWAEGVNFQEENIRSKIEEIEKEYK